MSKNIFDFWQKYPGAVILFVFAEGLVLGMLIGGAIMRRMLA